MARYSARDSGLELHSCSGVADLGGHCNSEYPRHCDCLSDRPGDRARSGAVPASTPACRQRAQGVLAVHSQAGTEPRYGKHPSYHLGRVPRHNTEHHNTKTVLLALGGHNVVRKPAVSLLAGLALLGVMATGLLGTSVGLDQIEKFRVKSESATGFEVLSQHYAPGEAQPIWVVANSDKAQNVVNKAETVEGIVRAHGCQNRRRHAHQNHGDQRLRTKHCGKFGPDPGLA